MMNIQCSMCAVTCRNVRQHCLHVKKRHSHEAKFIIKCEFEFCPYRGKTLDAWKKHLSRAHKDSGLALNTMQQDACEWDEAEALEERLDPKEMREFFVASYFLNLESQKQIPMSTLDYIGQATKELIALALSAHGIDNPNADICNLMEKFATPHLRSKFYRMKCNLVIPKPVLLGKSYVSAFGKTREKKQYAYIVPFWDQLKAVLALPEMQSFITMPVRSTDGFLRDAHDGAWFQGNNFFKANPHALSVILNIDDVCLVNPLGVRQKIHKYTMVYFTLGNIPVQFRSKLTSIFLIGIGKTMLVTKFGLRPFLQDFLTGMEKLEIEGIDTPALGNVKGKLLFSTNDDPAANFLAGMKQSASFSEKFCRTCNISQKQLQITDPKKVKLSFRCPKEHNKHCRSLERFKITAKAIHQYWSKHWGINTKSVLLELPTVMLSTQLIHDPLHVFLEGVFNQHACIFVQFAIAHKLFTLDWLNKQLSTYRYSYLDVANKPQPIAPKDIEKLHLKQTAVSTLLMVYILPHMLGQKINADTLDGIVLEAYKNFLNLINIVLLATSPIVNLDTPGELQLLIDVYIMQFKNQHPQIRLTPKTHYMRHIPEQIRLYGPGRGQWALRFESKHSEFKSQKLTNYRNVPKTLSDRAQRRQCFNMLTAAGERSPNFFAQPPQLQVKSIVNFAVEFPELLSEIKEIFPETPLDESAHISELSELVLDGLKFKRGAYLLLHTDFEGPIFGRILNLMVKEEDFFVIVAGMTSEWCWEFNAYRVSPDNETKIVLLTKLVNRWPLPNFLLGGQTYITNRYSHCQNGVCV